MTIHLRNAHHEFAGRNVAEARHQAQHLMNLGQTFRIACDQCQMAIVNGVALHEHGCPEAWRQHPAACRECGCDFEPDEAGQRICAGCADPMPDGESDPP